VTPFFGTFFLLTDDDAPTPKQTTDVSEDGAKAQTEGCVGCADAQKRNEAATFVGLHEKESSPEVLTQERPSIASPRFRGWHGTARGGVRANLTNGARN
jgi:hypothetical protein